MDAVAARVNYLAVLIAAGMAFAASLLWYSPLAFGDIWMQHRDAAAVSAPSWTMLVAPLRELIVAVVLAHLMARLSITKWWNAASLGFALWLAFHAVQMAGAVIWDNMPLALGAVHAGDWLMKMLLMPTVLALWPRAGFGTREQHAS